MSIFISYLEDCEKCYGKGIEVGRWCPRIKIKLTTKELHSQQGEYENEEEEQEEQGYDAAHRI